MSICGERRYGQRNLEWAILGIEFCGAIPHIWFPGSEKLVSIILTDAAALEQNEALFQLAHEVVHLLEPSRTTNAFEEGLATLFAHEISERFRHIPHTCPPKRRSTKR